MGQDLGPLNIKDTYQDLVQVSGSLLTDGTGSVIDNITVTASSAVTASYALNAEAVDTGSLLVTSSISDATITFTKGDASTYDLTVNNVANATAATTATSASHALVADNGGVTSIIAGSNITVDQATGDVTISAAGGLNTGSLLADASVTEGVLTFERGDQTTFDLQVNNVVNADSASYVPASGVDGTVSNAVSASHALQADNASSAASATTATSASYVLGSNVDGTVANATSASHAVQADSATSADSATTATTASYVQATNVDGTVATATSASHAEFADTLLGSVESATTASYILGSGVDGAVASATDATNADNIALTQDATDADRFITFTGTSTGDGTLNTDDGIKYNPFTNKLTTTGDLAIEGIADVSQSIADAAGSGGDNPFDGDRVISGSLNVSSSVGESNVVLNATDTYTSTAKVHEVVTLTGAEYDALTPDDNTLYLINDATGSIVVSASYAENATSASYVAKGIETGSVSGNVLTFTTFDESEFTLTVDTGSGGGGGDAFPFEGDAVITGSLLISGSKGLEVTGPVDLNNRGTAIAPSGSDPDNVLIGPGAGEDITTGFRNVCIGGEIFGVGAGESLTNGSENILIGAGAGRALVGNNDNISIGTNTIFTSTTHTDAVHIGQESGRDSSNITAGVFIGKWSGYGAQGQYSIGIGYRAGWKNTGNRNIWIGENVVGQTAGANFSDSNYLGIGSNAEADENLLYGYHGADSTPGDRFLQVTGLLNAPLQSTAPTGAGLATGSIYFDTSTLKLRCYDGTAWNNLF